MKNTKSVRQIAEILKSYSGKKVLLTTHMAPDGDAMGSMLGIGLIMQELGAELKCLVASRVPNFLKWLELPWPRHRNISELKDWTPDLLISLDCGDAQRAGAELGDFFEKYRLPHEGWAKLKSINIDHHFGNPLFASYNLVQPERAATAELVGMLVDEMGYSFSGLMGKALYLGLVSDTGNFSYSSTGVYSHQLAAKIIDQGLDVGEMTSLMDNNWTIEKMNLWGQLMSDLKLYNEGSIAGILVSKAILKKHKADKEDLAGFASWMRKLEGVKVTLFVREDGPKQTKLSFRSMGDVDVQTVAAEFSGGGHKAAAGALSSEAPQLVFDKAIEALKKAMA